MYNWYLEVLRDRVWSRFELDLRGAGWPETRLQTRLAISSFSQVSLSANFLLNTQIFLGTDTCFQTQRTKNATKISEFIEYSPSYLLVLILSWNTAQRRTQHKDFNKFRQQRQMIQITKKNVQLLLSNSNEKKTKSQDLLINLLCFFKENFRRQELNLNRLTDLSKPTNKWKWKWNNENKEQPFTILCCGSLLRNRHKWTQRNLFTIELLWITWGDQHTKKICTNLQLRNPK